MAEEGGGCWLLVEALAFCTGIKAPQKISWIFFKSHFMSHTICMNQQTDIQMDREAEKAGRQTCR